MTQPPKRSLEIGPGKKPLTGFDTFDCVGSPTYVGEWGKDCLTDIVGEAVYDEVYASHVLEHIMWNKTVKALRDVHPVLKPGGLLEIWVPNFAYIVECYTRQICGDKWRKHNPQSDPMLWVNGRLFTYGPGPENIHHACFDESHLANCLKQAGFVNIERLPKRKRGVSHGPVELGMTGRRPG